MSLSLGTGPLAGSPAGHFNFDLSGAPAHRIYFADHPARLRAVVAGATILDTTRGKLLYETGIPPVPYVPLEDLDQTLLERTDSSTHCPFKGDASYWTLRAGDRVETDFVWAYESPLPEASWLEGYAALYWKRVDDIYVEDERAFGHLRDPFHRVDALESSRRVRVTLNGEAVAESSRPVMVFETGLPPRPYLPRADVKPGVLAPSETRSICPYKGEASYWSVAGIEDGAWSYETPLPEALRAAGHVSFDGTGIEVEVH
ncbi:MAG: hypothetical protein AVDCRST_MAG30-2720 [uncultured Solirubrobacteraceae bacterium]|uniref:DUF427 domain-containing protein n=1 Tax=uncultured Solirubrobacteraceae bacterium TaxID=1162706 RepID=A0A6J4T7B8_9ACTN|nr:MAG: hypothetical protein AVDCRST_MAG30-2720 [uncultured Solirubrobacteraceae bacterium]